MNHLPPFSWPFTRFTVVPSVDTILEVARKPGRVGPENASSGDVSPSPTQSRRADDSELLEANQSIYCGGMEFGV